MKTIFLTMIAAMVCANAHAQIVSPKDEHANLTHIIIQTSVAQEKARDMLMGFMKSAEKEYMIAAMTAHTYFEIGGTRLDLERNDTIMDEYMRAMLKLWVENDPDKGVRFLKEYRNEKTLQDVEDELLLKRQQTPAEFLGVLDKHTQKRLEVVAKSKEKFKQFKNDENKWLMDHIGSLR